MASDLNNIMLIGRLTADPAQKYVPSGMAVVEFSIANNYYLSSKNTTEVNYFEIVAYGKIAETISKYLTKGSQIAINGNLRQERWQDKDTNSTRSRVRVIAQNIQMLGGNNSNNNMGNNDNSYTSMDTTYAPSSNSIDIDSFSDDDDDVPF